MTNKEYLELLLQENVELFGENDPSTLDLKRKLGEIEERLATGQNPPEILQFQAGFRKAKESKRPKA